MNRALLLSVLSFSLLALPVLQGCSSSPDESTADSSQDDLKKSCKGPLPSLCEICDDGSSACAHWVKENGKCTVEVCAPSTKACTGPLPQSCRICDDGSTGCAHWVKNDGKCEIQYCDPSTTGGGGSECSKDSDCKGPLPMSCQLCADGSDGCAHHTCDSGKCTISYCN